MLSIPTMDDAELRAGDADRIAQHGGKYRLEIARRAGNYLQNLRWGRFLFERFSELVGALLLRLEQPRVLDRNHRLIGECHNQFDLTVGEGVDPATREPDGADRLTLAHQRDT